MKTSTTRITRDHSGWLVASPAGLGQFIVGIDLGGGKIHVFGEYPTRGNAQAHADDVNRYGHGAQVWDRSDLVVTYTVRPPDTSNVKEG